MAESSDQAEASLQSSIYRGSREDFEHSCGQCFADEHDVEAHGFCIECQEYLCINCFRAHSKNKASREHKLLGESELQNVQIADISSTICTEKCPIHTNEIVKFFCTNHEELCCNDCVIISHINCQKDYITEKCKEILDSAEYQKTLQAIDTRQKTVDSVKLEANKAEKDSTTSYEDVNEEIRVFEQALNDQIQREWENIKLEAVTKRDANKQILNRVLSKCDEMSSNLVRIRKEILDRKEKKSLAQLFIAIKNADNALKSGEVNESVNMLHETKRHYHFERDDNMETVQYFRFGTIKDAGRTQKDVKMMKPTLAVLSIGSTKMTYGFSFRYKPKDVRTRHWRNSQGLGTNKAPTSLLIDPDGHSLRAFGYDAEQKYYSLVKEGIETEYFFFRGDYILKLYRDGDKKIAFVYDETGKKLPSVFVLSTLLRVLFKEVESFLQTADSGLRIETDVHFVLTAPKIFATAIYVLEEAAEQVDVVNENFTVMLETEASVAYIQDPSSYHKYKGIESYPLRQSQEGDRYILLDVKDHMSTITVYEVGKEKSTLLYHEPIQSLKDNMLTEELEGILSGIFETVEEDDDSGGETGSEDESDKELVAEHKIWQTFKSSYEEEYREMMSEIVSKTLSLRPESNLTVNIPDQLREIVERNTSGTVKNLVNKSSNQGNIRYTAEKLRIGYNILEKCFQRIISTITSELRLVLQDKAGMECNILILTGDCTYMEIHENCLKRNFPDLHIVVPICPAFAFVIGAAILGHS